jgi:hypothetical protein
MLKLGDKPNYPLTSDGCQICGREMKGKSFWVHLSIYGEILSLDYEGEDSQGCWQIGSTCANKIEAGLITKL